MKQTEILLQKRQGKFVIVFLAALFCSFIAFGSLINLIISPFEWSIVAVLSLTLIGAAIFINRLVQYFTYGNIWLVLESDGSVLHVFNKNQAGKVFNKTENIDLSKIKSFYIIKKRTRYLINNYAFGYNTGGILGSEEISAFPSLFDATQSEMNAVLQFVKISRPEIELGYENFFQKLGKR